MNILVFKTNIEDSKQIKYLSPHFKALDGIVKWDVDLNDCNKVLRVETEYLQPFTVVNVLANAGHFCAELQD